MYIDIKGLGHARRDTYVNVKGIGHAKCYTCLDIMQEVIHA